MILHLKILVFIVVSTGIIYLSRASILNILTHGFYRFFAFEAILVLILINIDKWFSDPFSFYQIISWIILILSLFLALHGFYLLRKIGGTDPKRNDPSLFGLEKTGKLVTTGVYRYIRHPLYCSLLLFGWGTFLKNITWTTLITVLVTTIFLFLTAKKEETENINYYGDEYLKYMKSTTMFIPFSF